MCVTKESLIIFYPKKKESLIISFFLIYQTLKGYKLLLHKLI